MTAKEQEQFEKWMTDSGFGLFKCPYSDGYETPEVRMAWAAWQARAVVAEQSLERIIKAHRS